MDSFYVCSVFTKNGHVFNGLFSPAVAIPNNDGNEWMVALLKLTPDSLKKDDEFVDENNNPIINRPQQDATLENMALISMPNLVENKHVVNNRRDTSIVHTFNYRNPSTAYFSHSALRYVPVMTSIKQLPSNPIVMFHNPYDYSIISTVPFNKFLAEFHFCKNGKT